MAVTKNKAPTFKKFNLSFTCPWILYDSTENGRDIVSVDFLIPNVHRSYIKVQISPCGTILYCGIVVPKDFYNWKRQLDANQHDTDFNNNTHKAASFRKVCDLIEDLANENDEVLGDPMVIKLPFKVEQQFYKAQEIFDNDEDGWEVLMIDNECSKLKEELEEDLGEDEEAIVPDHFLLTVNMVSVVKPKTKKVKDAQGEEKATASV